MPLNDQQKAELEQMLNSDLFRRATEEVLRLEDAPVYDLLAPEQGMALATQKGVRNAFRRLHSLYKPERQAPQGPKVKVIKRTNQ